MYLNNKYTRIYYQIIDRAKTRPKPKINEKHHIIPKCKAFGGPNTKENIIPLTFKEHFICHHLLLKMCKTPQQKSSMYYAFTRMGMKSKTNKRIINSKIYERIKIVNRNLCSGENSYLYGKKASEETKKKLSKSHICLKASDETKKKISQNHSDISGKKHPMYGKHHSEESKKKMSEKLKGKVSGNKGKKGQIPWNKGKKTSKETKKKISKSLKGRIAWNKGKLFSKETRIKMSESAKKRYSNYATTKIT